MPSSASSSTISLASADTDGLVRGYVPNFLDLQSVAMATELRQVTTLFVSLPLLDFDQDSTSAFDDMQSVTEAIQVEIARFQGTLKQILVDDKGAVAVIFFGLPGSSHEDNAARAVRSALGVKKFLLASNFPCSIGITTAPVFVGIVGNQSRCEYAAFGSGVNKSARLMGVSLKSRRATAGADVHIVIDNQTFREASRRSSFQVNALAPVMLKGLSKPEVVFEPTSWIGRQQSQRRALSDAQTSSTIVGREEELRVIMDAASRPKSVIMLIAGAGVGKSALVRESLRRLIFSQSLGFLVLESGADPSETLTPLFPFRSIMTSVFLYAHQSLRRKKRGKTQQQQLSTLKSFNLSEDSETSASEDWELRDEQITEVLRRGKLAVRLAPLFNSLLGSTLAENPQTQRMKPADRRQSLIQLCTDLITLVADRLAESKSSLCLVIQDIHWIDEASIALLQRLIQRHGEDESSSVFFLLNSRPITTESDLRDDEDGPEDKNNVGAGVNVLQSGKEKVDDYIASFIRHFLHDDTKRSQFLFLKNMSAPDSRQLIARVLQCTTIDDELFHSIYARSVGNALFTEELAHHLLDRSLVEVSDTNSKEMRLKSGASDLAEQFPASVQATITARLDKVPSATAHALKVASIIGRDFSLDHLRRLLGHSVHSVDQHLRILAKRDFISFSRKRQLARFKHDVVMCTVYGLLPFKERQGLHHSYAKALMLVKGDGAATLSSNGASLSISFKDGRDLSLPSYHAALAVECAPEMASQELLELAIRLATAGVRRSLRVWADSGAAVKVGTTSWEKHIPLLRLKTENSSQQVKSRVQQLELSLIAMLGPAVNNAQGKLAAMSIFQSLYKLLDDETVSDSMLLQFDEDVCIESLAMYWGLTMTVHNDAAMGEKICKRIINLAKESGNSALLNEGRHFYWTNHYISMSRRGQAKESLEMMAKIISPSFPSAIAAAPV